MDETKLRVDVEVPGRGPAWERLLKRVAKERVAYGKRETGRRYFLPVRAKV